MSEEEAWQRPTSPKHAHFDCFSGAAGDMMLAACLDAARTRPGGMRHIVEESGGDDILLLDKIVQTLKRGLPEMADEFEILQKTVHRSKGKIAAKHVQVTSKYHHAPAPVPSSRGGAEHQCRSHSHEHEHISHSHDDDDDEPMETADHQSSDDKETKQSATQHTHEHHHHHKDHSDDAHEHSHNHPSGPLRNLPEIRRLLQTPAAVQWIPSWVCDTAILTFTKLALAEAAVHGADSADAVHFHEVGAVDSIVDVVGTLVALYELHCTTFSCSTIPVGSGTVWTAHGLLPVPAPATTCLLIGLPTMQGPPGGGGGNNNKKRQPPTGELVTPTGAALLQVLTLPTAAHPSMAGYMPNVTLQRVGVGAGTKDFDSHANILRVLIGELSSSEREQALPDESHMVNELETSSEEDDDPENNKN